MPFRWIGKSKDEKSVQLQRLDLLSFPVAPYATPQWIEQNADIVRTGAVVDVETTGLSHAEEEIIELGIRLFLFNKNTGELLKIENSYSCFQDPGRPLRPEITKITGITDEMLQGQKINWTEADHLLEQASIIIAHNARFDRPFIDKKSKISPNKIWGCSIKQIDWLKRGYTSSKLELLSIYHGFFTDAHRAINDADALLYLLTLNGQISPEKTYFFDLLQEAKKPLTQVIALAAPFETKDILKQRGYSWDNVNRFWNKTLHKEDIPAETQWLEENVYLGPSRGVTRDISLTDTFKI